VDTTADYVKNCPNDGASEYGFNTPAGGTIDSTNHWLFTADSSNNRVLVFPLTSGNLLSSKTPSYVIGQPDFVTCAPNQGGSASQTSLFFDVHGTGPDVDGLAIDPTNNLLYVPDIQNNRVMVFPTSAMANGESASYVLGQTGYTATGGSTAQTKLDEPSGVALDTTNHRLYVADAGNNRVLVFPTSGLTTGESATYVLGQSGYTTSTAATTQTGLSLPDDVAIDVTNSKLYVADVNNSRVMVFPTSSLTTHESATYVLGQTSYTTSTQSNGPPSQTGLDDAVGVTLDTTNSRLFVSDFNNDRVLVFPTSSLTTGESATYVLGNTDFVGDNNGDQSYNGFGSPGRTIYDSTNNLLYVTDGEFHRVLEFPAASDYTTGLVGWWQLLDGSGTSAADSSGNSNTGALQHTPTWATSGPNGGGLTLNGSNQYVKVTDAASLDISGSWTVSAWVNMAATPGSGKVVALVNKDDGSSHTNYALIIDNGLVSAGLGWIVTFSNSSGTSYYAKYVTSISTGTWYHIAGVYSSSANTLTLYVNGVSEASTSVTGDTPVSDSGAPLAIGAGYTSLAFDYANGTFDDVRVYNSALTTAQVDQVYSHISDGVNATDELGQYTSPSSTATDAWLDSGPNNGPTALGFDGPSGVALDPVNHYLYVSDCNNNRVMVYTLNSDNSISTSSGGHTASFVLGQTSLQGAPQINDGSGPANALGCPLGLAVDTVHNRLFVDDQIGDRVLVFTTPVSNGQSASYVLGEPDFVSYDSGGTASQTQLFNPTDVAYDSVNNLLYVADDGNERIMEYNVASISNGMSATYELGQATWTTQATATTQTGMGNSTVGVLTGGLAVDTVNNRLFVADPGNSRVLVFKTPISANDASAAYVLGQSSFTTSTQNTTQSGMYVPDGVDYDANNNRLFVWENNNSRVLVFNVAPNQIANGESASFVLGQSSFTTSTIATTQSGVNLDTISGAEDAWGFAKYDPGSGRLFVTDSVNNRIMIFGADFMPSWTSEPP